VSNYQTILTLPDFRPPTVPKHFRFLAFKGTGGAEGEFQKGETITNPRK